MLLENSGLRKTNNATTKGMKIDEVRTQVWKNLKIDDFQRVSTIKVLTLIPHQMRCIGAYREL